ncbi:hypothetical protein [Burkholderia sp. 22PA0106]|uniref:hypothetical protein n=1 Tax=Burkholderia sp. 22PA0106 TaxID=3237371 RepID=UPI0039C20429
MSFWDEPHREPYPHAVPACVRRPARGGERRFVLFDVKLCLVYLFLANGKRQTRALNRFDTMDWIVLISGSMAREVCVVREPVLRIKIALHRFVQESFVNVRLPKPSKMR